MNKRMQNGTSSSTRLDANRLLDRVSVNSRQHNTPDQRLAIHTYLSIIRLANRYSTAGGQKVNICLPKAGRFSQILD
jgi:hypothetical protein